MKENYEYTVGFQMFSNSSENLCKQVKDFCRCQEKDGKRVEVTPFADNGTKMILCRVMAKTIAGVELIK